LFIVLSSNLLPETSIALLRNLFYSVFSVLFSSGQPEVEVLVHRVKSAVEGKCGEIVVVIDFQLDICQQL